jgi:hypothetical protein
VVVAVIERGDSQGRQLLLDQESDVVGAHTTTACLTDTVRDLLEIYVAVAEFRDLVQERRKLNEALSRVHEKRRLLKPRTRVRAQQLDVPATPGTDRAWAFFAFVCRSDVGGFSESHRGPASNR